MSNFRRQRLQYLSAISGSILTLTGGFNLAWPSPSLPYLTSDNSPIGCKLDVATATIPFSNLWFEIILFCDLSVVLILVFFHAGSFLTLTVGFNLAWPSPSLHYLTSDNSPIGYKLDVEQSSWASSITMLGILTGNFFLGQLQDIFGRRGLLLLVTLPTIGAWLLIGFTKSYELLLVARFLTGMLNVVPTMTTAIYISEISEPSIRGKLGMFNLSIIEVGMVVITAVGSYTSYLTTAIVGACIPAVFFVIFFWMPESPYYYLRKGDVDSARKSLQRLRVDSDIEKELVDIQTCVEKQMKEKSHILELFKTAKYRKGLLIGLGLKTLQQMSGTIAINSYNKVIFEKVSTGLDASVSAMISTSVAIPATLIGSVLIDKLGRKPLYYASTMGCAVSLLFEFIFFLMQDYLKSDVSNLGWLPIVGIFLFNIFRTFGIQTLPVIILSEIFPTNMKALGQNVVLMYSSIVGFLVSLGFPLLVDAWGMYTCFGIFVVFCLLGFCFIYFFIPETKGKSLGDIQNKIEKAVKTDKF